MRAFTALALCAALLAALPAAAQDRRLVEVQFTPTARAQLALWIESADGETFRTLRLTESVAYRGIGNRPGASTMNSGFRWPYGRREGVLPVWAHRRVEAGGAAFPRVIFQSRREGFASRTTSDHSLDDYFCLSFTGDSSRDGLDAVSCASPFNSDKGRYVTETDVTAGYAEPVEDASGASPVGAMSPMPLTSLYPPRRDLGHCELGGVCYDHADLGEFAADALAAMPELDAVTMATPMADVEQRIVLEVPEAWPDGNYVVYLEISVEGDYNASFDPTRYPTPTTPSGEWDYWARNYGYPFRGQPSVVFSIPFRIGGGGSYTAAEPIGYGSLSGTGPDGGDIRPMGAAITDDPVAAPGSGADRLRLGERTHRLRVVTVGGEPPRDPEPDPTCDPSDPDPPPECCAPGDTSCDPTDPDPTDPDPDPTDPDPDPDPDPPIEPPVCEGALICLCQSGNAPPDGVTGLEALPHPDPQRGHEWARLRFRVPSDDGGIGRYEVRVGTRPIVDEASFLRAVPAKEATLESVELALPTDGAPGDLVEVDFGGLSPQTRYYVGVRARDACDDPGPLAVTEVETTEVVFTTVSPCFVATAAYGTPMADEIRVLRRLRDRHLRTNAPGRALVALYHRLGPPAARFIAGDEGRRGIARAVLSPVVALARWLAD